MVGRLFLLSLLVAFLSTAVAAQTRVDVGAAIGQQRYGSSSDNPRVLTGGDLLVRGGGPWGGHLAVEYADLTEEGALIVTHADAVYRQPIGGAFYLLAGFGATFASKGSLETTWNAEVELGRAWPRADLFARVRQYDFDLTRFREGDAGPDGPAVYVGVRFRVR